MTRDQDNQAESCEQFKFPDPPEDSSFSDLPIRYLQVKNPLPFDDEVKFTELGHRYSCKSPYLQGKSNEWIENCPQADTSNWIPLQSATSVKEQYFDSFNSELIASRILKGIEFREKGESDPTYRYYKCKSVEDVLRRFRLSAAKGSVMHAHFENLSNLLEYDRDHPGESTFAEYVQRVGDIAELKYFISFCDQMGISEGRQRFYRSELYLYHPDLNYCGALDSMLVNTETGAFTIVDFKRCRGGVPDNDIAKRVLIHKLNSSSRGKILPSLMRHRNVKIVHYGLQLSLYRAFVHRASTSMRVDNLVLMVVDSELIGESDALDIIRINANKYDQEIAEIFDHRARDYMHNYKHVIPEELKKALRTYYLRSCQAESVHMGKRAWDQQHLCVADPSSTYKEPTMQRSPHSTDYEAKSVEREGDQVASEEDPTKKLQVLTISSKLKKSHQSLKYSKYTGRLCSSVLPRAEIKKAKR